MNAAPVRIRSGWGRAVLLCGKCSRKIDGGFGADGDRPLAKALRRWLGIGKGRKASIGIVETKCLGICPKRAIVMIDAAHPEQWWIVAAGTPIDEVAVMLGLARQA